MGMRKVTTEQTLIYREQSNGTYNFDAGNGCHGFNTGSFYTTVGVA